MPSPTITALPTPPSRATDTPTEFADNADALLGALPTFVTELNAYGDDLADSNGVANYSASSTTSVAIGTGSKSFTVETGKRFVAGTFLTIADSAAPTTNYLYGQVTSYNSLTGALVFDSQRVGGSGTKTSWLISLSGPQGEGGDTLPAFAGNGLKFLQLNAGETAAQWADIDSYVQLAASYTLTSTTSSQKLFNHTAAGALTLALGVHAFELQAVISSMSATSGNAVIDLKGAGTAVIGATCWHSTGFDGSQTAATASAFTSTMYVSGVSIIGPADTTSTSLLLKANGLITVTTAGTIIPSIALTTAAAAGVSAGSFFRCTRLGASAYSGSWS